MEYILIAMLGMFIGFRMSQIICNRKTKILHTQLDKYQKEKNKEASSKSVLEDKIWHQQETEFVFKLHEKFALAMDKENIIKQIVEGVYKFIYVEKVILLLLDKSTDKFVMEYSIGLDKSIIDNFKLYGAESISGRTVVEQKTLVVNDFDKEGYLRRINREPYFKKSFIEVPVIFQKDMHNKDVLGVLIVCDKKSRRPFSKKDEVLLENVGRVCAMALKNAQLHSQMQDDYLRTITAFAAALDARDPYTRWHSENVMRYSVEIAKTLGFSRARIETLRRAALLHDIGKIGISDRILLKAGKLTPEEFEQIKLHPLKGEVIIKNLPFLKEITLLIRHHHERYDGKGYPDGIKGEKIELGARILAVADSFDAMTSDRPYRKAIPLDEAVNQLKVNKGTQFSPEVVDCFLSVLKDNPGIVHP